ncbi:hypothetical protein E2C01_045957 [Portunus trituberculatus]|uniref:Uncharacterized protein n=1 Tax=Portunus trituberculatus TaxID=210409 RepID=A0A5B7G3C7_PORTR|nr:hypothetical protein [Portunus trituberculatus]
MWVASLGMRKKRERGKKNKIVGMKEGCGGDWVVLELEGSIAVQGSGRCVCTLDIDKRIQRSSGTTKTALS